ncbi:MAG: ABC transporter permease [Oscillospiraceae bacterium]|nr:ABC transporter permease [Oscillospiraceae bacterium]
MRKKTKNIFSFGYLAFVFLFLYVPIFILIVFSFNSSKSKSVWGGFTFDWYIRLFGNELIIKSLINTLLLALISSAVAAVIGTAAAIGIHAMRKTAKAVIMNITYLPVLNPEIITGVSFMLLFAFVNFESGFSTLLAAHISFCVPYVILNLMPKLRQIDRYQYEAALDLGCSPYQAFFLVILPEILPGIVSGFLMAFTYSIDDVVISLFVSGPEMQTLPVTIYSMTRKQISPEINALSAIMFVVVLALLAAMNIKDIRDAKKRESKYFIHGG